MCVSESFCQRHLPLLFHILETSHDAICRGNILIGLGDLVVSFNNVVERNISILYQSLNDLDFDVKKNALMVLTHLILNGMVKVKGELAEMALCVEDADVRVSQMSKQFFAQLTTKDDSAIYNNIADIISNLWSRPTPLEEPTFRAVMRFLFGFIRKVWHLQHSYALKSRSAKLRMSRKKLFCASKIWTTIVVLAIYPSVSPSCNSIQKSPC